MSTAINGVGTTISGTRRSGPRIPDTVGTVGTVGTATQEPCGLSADRIYRYTLGPTPVRTRPAERSDAGGRGEWFSVTINGPGAHSSMVHGFDDRTSALTWVRIHAALSDLGKYRYLRQTVATHRWASLDPDPNDAAMPTAA